MNIGEVWTEIKIMVDKNDAEAAESIVSMATNLGIYIEDYSDLKREAMEVAHIDLFDEALLSKDRENVVIHMYVSSENSPAEATQFISERLKNENIKFNIELAKSITEDWINNWKKYFKPMPIGEKLLIHPVWEEKVDPKGRVVMHLEPGLAFGTGTHETTRLCLETLEKYVKPGDEILDVGCGSGILSIAALLLGGKSAVGVDIDPIAVKTADENARMNSVSDKFTALCGSLTDKVSGKFDIVIANIVADIIIELTENVQDFMKPGAVYIMSGIIDTREADVLNCLSELFEILSLSRENGWVAIAAKPKAL